MIRSCSFIIFAVLNYFDACCGSEGYDIYAVFARPGFVYRAGVRRSPNGGLHVKLKREAGASRRKLFGNAGNRDSIAGHRAGDGHLLAGQGDHLRLIGNLVNFALIGD